MTTENNTLKKTRAPKTPRQPALILKAALGLPLRERVDLIVALKQSVEEEKETTKAAYEQMEKLTDGL